MPVRIYDISVKYGIHNKEVLALAKSLGIATAKVPSSSLDKISAEYLENELLKARPELTAKPASPKSLSPANPRRESKPKISSLPPATVARHSASPPPFVPLKFRGLTHDDIVFRVLLQREEGRTALTFNALERSLPKELLKSIEPDWRSYIREEGLEFDSAFQKAVRKHLPGIYYVVMAAEFLGKIHFHFALLSFLQPDAHGLSLSALNEEEVFELADFLAQEVHRRAAAQARETQSPPVHHADAPPPKLTKPAHTVAPIPVLATESNGVVARPASAPGAVRKCAFCRRHFPASAIWQHVDREHINPPHLGTGPSQGVKPTTYPADTVRVGVTNHSIGCVVVPTDPRFSRFRGHRCIGCGKPPIPGDFYCYHCAPK